MAEQLSGVVETVVFQSADRAFCVFKVSSKEEGSVSVVMNSPAPLLGEEVLLQGAWTQHARFGRQFKAASCRSTTQTSCQGIERFLGSGAVRGIGRALAGRLVAHFGLDTMRVLSEEPARLTEVSGIGRKKAALIFSSYSELAEIRELMLFLEEHGISANYAPKLQSVYGAAAIDMVTDNPYRLSYDIEGIGFQIADRIARSLGIAPDDGRRLKAGIEYALQKVAQAGHVCVPREILEQETARLLSVPVSDAAGSLQELLTGDYLRTEYFAGQYLIYPEYLYAAEVEAARRLLRLKERARPLASLDPEEILEQWENRSGFKLAKVQREAIDETLTSGVLVMTGGPGTGKTTLVRGIISVLEAAGCRILLAAPTGRAARRLSESTGRPALTVHKLLEYVPHEGPFAFGRHEGQPLEADAVIVDEASMLDISLTACLLRAIPLGCRLLLVGDVDQLPAVGPGNVLKDIIRSQQISVVRLNEVFRQEAQSRIVLNAHRINRGLSPDFTAPAEFSLTECADEAAVADEIVSLYKTLWTAGGQQDVQVLSPMHKLACGVENLNRLLQEAVNPPDPAKEELASLNQILREGDRIMQIKNNYDKEVFNGDLGWVKTIESRSLTAWFPDVNEGKAVRYEQGELDELQLSYAMSVHKSQGSEYPVVILALSKAHYIFLQRNLLYTAVTRARRQVFIAGQKSALLTAVANDRTRRRYSLLAERLRETILC